jgi:Ca-activated chloride channel family protein
MKANKVAALAALGMLLTSVSVYSLTPPGGLRATGGAPPSHRSVPEKLPEQPTDSTPIAHFSAGSTLMIEGRLGHPRLSRSAQGETFMMLEVKSADGPKGRVSAPVNLALVIDRSGSMKGSRIRNAVSAATAAVDRLNDGDVVSVVTFDTQVQVVVPPAAIGPGSRERVAASIRGITLGGDTCVSCGIEEGMALIERTPGKVNRMIVLSDGDANHGVRDVPGFRAIAQRAMSRGIPVTTIGVDVDYNEKIMAAIAQDSNGRHFFVANDADLSRVFEAEAEGLTATVASGAEVVIDLAPGVELDRVFDRAFRRSGDRIIIPLGTFGPTDVKTVLLKVRAPSQIEGTLPIASVDLAYRDIASNTDGHAAGKLALEITSSEGGATDLDPVVNGRVQRSETAAVLKDANGLFEQGRVEEAKRKLDVQERTLRSAAEVAQRSAPATKAKQVEADLQNQIAALGGANADFAAAPKAAVPSFATPPPGVLQTATAPPPPPQATREGKSAVRSNQQRAVDLAF